MISCAASPLDSNPCFPSSATVTMSSGASVLIDTLKEGDSVLASTIDGVITHDTVTLLSIAKPDATASFVSLSTSSNLTLSLTAGHHLPVGTTCCAQLKKAQDIKLGETVWTAQAGSIRPTVITNKLITHSKGLHSPVLMAGGFPIVDGFITAFDSINKVALAKKGLSSILTACQATGTCALFRDLFFDKDGEYVTATH
jgi:hypothetical protein